MKKGGLRRRWLTSTLAVVSALGLVCALAITAVFATYYYSNAESELRYLARNAAGHFAGQSDQEFDSYYSSCIAYAGSFETPADVELQFVDVDGTIVSSSHGLSIGMVAATPDTHEAKELSGIRVFLGSDPAARERVMSVSTPLIYGDGETVGVFRFVSATHAMDMKIIMVALICAVVFIVVVIITVLSTNYYIRSILVPVAEITEKAKRIAGGSYGIQIQKKYDDEIGALADSINDLSDKISQNEKMQTEFISSLSHELRTPLTAITGWSETLLTSETLDADTSRGMKIILREAKRLTEMVVDLLDFTRIQDGRMTLNVETADIRGDFEDTVYMYGSRLTQDGIDLVYLDNDDDIPEIPCDPKRMRQVFLNILDNAAKHGGEGKRIEASVGLEDRNVVFRIRDFGPGIPEDEIPLVKKKFYKGSSKARGTGIGLAVCDEIVEMHGGTLTLENAEGGGTMVTVSIPVQ